MRMREQKGRGPGREEDLESSTKKAQSAMEIGAGQAVHLGMNDYMHTALRWAVTGGILNIEGNEHPVSFWAPSCRNVPRSSSCLVSETII